MRALTAFFLMLLLSCLAQATPAGVDTGDEARVIRREVFRDASRTLALAQVQDAVFTPVDDIFAGGYSKDAIWMRVVVRPARNLGPLVLQILPAYLNQITLYEPVAGSPGTWRTQVVGNRTPWQDRATYLISLGFGIQPLTETTYYLRLDTLSTALMDVQAVTVKEASRRDMTAMVWQAAYIGIIIAIVLWALQDGWLKRDRPILLFAGIQIVYLFYVICVLGYASVLWPDAKRIPEITFWSVSLGVFFSLLFHRELLRLSVIARYASWAIDVLIACSLAVCALLLFGHTSLALKLNSTVALAAAPVLFAVALTARGHASLSAGQIKSYYGLLMLTLFFYIAPVLGLIQGHAWSLYGALIQGLVSAVLFGHLLYARSRRLLAQQHADQISLQLSEHENTLQKNRLKEQSQFTAMFAHELKNPLASIRFNLDGLRRAPGAQLEKRHQRIDQAIADIDALVERCVLADRMEQGQSSWQMGEADLQRLFTEFIEQYAVADRVRIDAQSNTCRVTSDPQLLAVIVANLLDNALKYSVAGSLIEVELGVSGGDRQQPGVRVEVHNLCGPAGLPDPARVFDKYYRGKKASGQAGTGLGLFLVKGLVERLGGHIDCSLQQDRITFSLWIPQSPP